ncbi:MAG: AzlD domain-containing protein [Zoogloeaceae bacterium]|nr:AzlD domain-containing protein [Zoogloeaceae bacterium]
MSQETGYDASLWLIFILVGLATTLPRASFIVLGSRILLPSVLQRALRYAPAAALAGIVVPDILLVNGDLSPFNPKLAAAIATVAAAMLSRNPWLPFIAGMGTLLTLRMGLGWQ